MANISLSKAKIDLIDIVHQVACRGERIVLTCKGKQLVAIISIEDLRALEAIENKIDLEEAKKALHDTEKHGTVSWEQAKRELGL